MTICRSCSSEIPAPDRYCRNCGAPAAPAVAELDDTRRFNPSAPLPANAAGMPDTTNPLYAPSAPAYAAPQNSIPYQTASLAKKLLRRKFLWALAMIILVIAIFGVGVGVGSNFSDSPAERRRFSGERAEPEENAEELRAKFEEAVQNALGFKQGSYSATEFPEQQGIFINSLMSDDSPAALAKIQAGDLLTELNDKVVRNDSELSKTLESLKTGDDVPLKIYRDGAIITSRIKIGDRHFPPLQPKLDPDNQGFLGILDSTRRCCLPGTKKWGVEATELHVNGPAELFGLKTGDVISEFDGHAVKTPNEFNRRIRAVKPGSKVSITYYRGNTQQKVEVIMGHRW